MPEADVAAVCRWADEKAPPEIRDRWYADVEFEDEALTVVECSVIGDSWLRVETARLEWSSATGRWTLFCFNGDGDAVLYPYVKPTTQVSRILSEIDADPTCIFWG